MYDIPEIVEQLYNYVVVIPDKRDWPKYLGNSELVGRSLYSFYYGLRIGAQLSDVLRGEAIDKYTFNVYNEGAEWEDEAKGSH